MLLLVCQKNFKGIRRRAPISTFFPYTLLFFFFFFVSFPREGERREIWVTRDSGTRWVILVNGQSPWAERSLEMGTVSLFPVSLLNAVWEKAWSPRRCQDIPLASFSPMWQVGPGPSLTSARAPCWHWRQMHFLLRSFCGSTSSSTDGYACTHFLANCLTQYAGRRRRLPP